ncbi:MAG: lactate utilization protein [Patescibacteria group bacterium]
MNIQKTIESLSKNGFTAELAPDSTTAVNRVKELIPAGSEVMTMTSVTLDTIGLADLLNKAPYVSVRDQISALPKEAAKQRRQLGTAPDYAVGSVHAVSEEGQIFVASNTGSQLPAYLYGAAHVIWVVGTQKIVPDQKAALDRIYTDVLSKESARANTAYGITTGSHVSKLVIFDREIKPGRIHLIFVPETLGF